MNEWILNEKSNVKNLGHFETIFTLSNGYMGYRGTPAFAHEKGKYGFYIAGVYNKTPFFGEELVNIASPLHLDLIIDNESVNFSTSDVENFYYELNMKDGILDISYVLTDKKNRKTLIKEKRLLHLKYKQILYENIEIRPLNYSSQVILKFDFSTENAYTEVKGEKNYHLKKRKIEILKNSIYLETETSHTKIKIGQYVYFKFDKSYKDYFLSKQNGVEKGFFIETKKNKNIKIEVYMSVFNSTDTSSIKKDAINLIKKVIKSRDFIKTHIFTWHKKWEKADVKIYKDSYAQKITRYNIFNLIGLSPYKKGISIGAKGLHGEGYRGHVFWDTEIYLLPFYLLTDIKTAKNILYYRIERFKKAKEYAKKLGYKGCRYPWESALTGEDVTPKEGDTSKQEHIIADIFYAIYNFYLVSNDKKFIKKLIPILIESARYFESRVEYDKKLDIYIIKNQIGPDEFHQGINNNFYTNYMVKKLFENVINFVEKEKIKISKKEKEKWAEIKEKIYLPFSKEKGFHEQFDGYFKLKEMDMKIDKNRNRILSEKLMEIYNSPEAVKVFGKTKLIKQADTIMAYNLFFNDFDINVIKKAYNYYDKRTTHGSSLSRAPYIIVGARIGEVENAYLDFLISAALDIKDLKNSAGIHAASLGGVYQSLVYGFSGISFSENYLLINPNLPKKWKKLDFMINYKNKDIKINCFKNKVLLKSKSKKIIKVKVKNKEYLLKNKLEVKL